MSSDGAKAPGVGPDHRVLREGSGPSYVTSYVGGGCSRDLRWGTAPGDQLREAWGPSDWPGPGEHAQEQLWSQSSLALFGSSPGTGRGPCQEDFRPWELCFVGGASQEPQETTKHGRPVRPLCAQCIYSQLPV